MSRKDLLRLAAQYWSKHWIACRDAWVFENGLELGLTQGEWTVYILLRDSFEPLAPNARRRLIQLCH